MGMYKPPNTPSRPTVQRVVPSNQPQALARPLGVCEGMGRCSPMTALLGSIDDPEFVYKGFAVLLQVSIDHDSRAGRSVGSLRMGVAALSRYGLIQAHAPHELCS